MVARGKGVKPQLAVQQKKGQQQGNKQQMRPGFVKSMKAPFAVRAQQAQIQQKQKMNQNPKFGKKKLFQKFVKNGQNGQVNKQVIKNQNNNKQFNKQKNNQQNQNQQKNKQNNANQNLRKKIALKNKVVKKDNAPKIVRGEKDDPECWELAQLGTCPRYPCKWAPCTEADISDPIYAGARVNAETLRAANIEVAEAEALGFKVYERRQKGNKGAKKGGQQQQQNKQKNQQNNQQKSQQNQQNNQVGKKNKKNKQNQNANQNNPTAPVQKQGQKQKKGKGKGKKNKQNKEKKERKPLVGPNGETADDDTCWEVKQTGLCPRFPCKWQPCADLPEDDVIFENAKKRGQKKEKKEVKEGAAKEGFKKQF